MADLKFSVSSGAVSVTTSAVTVLQITAPANHRVVLTSLLVTLDGLTTAGDSALVKIVRQTGGTFTGTVTPRKHDDSLAEAIQTTASTTQTAAPTAGDELRRFRVVEGISESFPRNRAIIIGGGDKIGIEVTADAAATVEVTATCEE